MIKRLSLLLFIAAGCSHSSPAEPSAPPLAPAPATAPAPPSAPAPAPANVLTDPHRFDCQSDSDCLNSCQHGAVSATWYHRAESSPGFQECEDGCANQISAPPRCEQGGCVAYQRDPHDSSVVTRSDDCTRIGG